MATRCSQVLFEELSGSAAAVATFGCCLLLKYSSIKKLRPLFATQPGTSLSSKATKVWHIIIDFEMSQRADCFALFYEVTSRLVLEPDQGPSQLQSDILQNCFIVLLLLVTKEPYYGITWHSK